MVWLGPLLRISCPRSPASVGVLAWRLWGETGLLRSWAELGFLQFALVSYHTLTGSKHQKFLLWQVRRSEVHSQSLGSVGSFWRLWGRNHASLLALDGCQQSWVYSSIHCNLCLSSHGLLPCVLKPWNCFCFSRIRAPVIMFCFFF